MDVIPLTILLSLLLAGLFAVLFVRERRGRWSGRDAQASLRPLDDEQTRSPGK